MAAENVAGISFELTFDGSKMTSSINASCKKVRQSFENAFNKAGKTATKTIETSNEQIKAILDDTEKSMKSKAASIAAIYRKEGDSQKEALKKAWSLIERSSASSSEKVKRNFLAGFRKIKNGAEDVKISATNSFTSFAKKAGAALAGAFAVKKIVDFGKQCMELGSDLQEVQNVVDVTFPGMSKQVDQFAQSAAASFGLSETMAKQYTGTFGAMAKAFGFTEKQAYDMGTTLTGLAGDVASFYNLSQDEAYTKLKSVFTGETESLKDLGVVMTQTALDSYAMANGFGKTTSAMSEAEKVALRYAFVQDQLTAAQGDFARTSDSWANQTKIMSLQLQSLMATIGQGLINLFTPVIKIVNVVLGKLMTLANAFKSFTELITGKRGGEGSAAPIAELAGTADTASSGLSDASGAAGSLADATNGVGNAARRAAKEMKALMGFDQIQKLDAQNDSSGEGTSGGSGTGSGGASLGSAVDFGSLAEGETVIDEVDSRFTEMFQNIQRLCEPTVQSLKKLWSEGLSKLGSFAWDTLRDFWNNFLKPLGAWMLSDSSGLPRFLDITNSLLTEINWEGLKTSLGDFYTSLQNVAKFSWNTVMDFYDSFLKPLSVWTFSEALPRLADCFTRLNNEVEWDSIRTSLNNVWIALEPFYENIGEGLLWFYENVLTPLGTWVANEVIPSFLDTLSIAIGAFNVILEALQPLFQWFWDSVLQPIAQWTGDTFLALWDGINGALQKFSDWCAENPGAVQVMATVIGSFFAAFKIVSIVSGIGGMVEKFGGLIGIVGELGGLISSVLNPWTIALAAIIAVGIGVWKNWDTIKAKAIEIWGAIKDWFSETIESIKEFFTGLWSGVKETFAEVGDWFKEKFDAAVENVHNAFSAIGTWFGERWQEVQDALSSVGDWFTEKFEAAYTAVKDAWSGAGEAFGSIWDNITGAFGDIAGWFQDKFSAAWQAVKDVFSAGGEVFLGITDGILDGLKGVINGLISGINQVITIPFNGINTALNGIKSVSIFGLKPFDWMPTIPVPQIPQLAEGGYVRANTPQLAMIGDNRHQGEVVAPENKLQAMLDAAVRAAGAQGLTKEEAEAILNRAVMRIIAALSQMGFYIDSEEIARATQKGSRSTRYQFNKVELE